MLLYHRGSFKMEKILLEILKLLEKKSSNQPEIIEAAFKLRQLDCDNFMPGAAHGVNVIASVNELEENYIKLAKQLYSYGGVPWFKGREDLAYSEEDFISVATAADLSFCFYQIILQKLHDSSGFTEFPDVYTRIVKELCVFALLLVGEHQDVSLMWSNEHLFKAAADTHNIVLSVCSCDSITEILTNPCEKSLLSKGLLSALMAVLQPRLQTQSWKQNPSIRHVYYWLLLQVKSPNVGENLQILFPPPMMLLDHHHIENKVLGVKCLRHILAETSSSEIQWYGHSDVIYQSLQHQLYQHEPQLLQELLPCLHDLLKATELTSTNIPAPQMENRFDEVFPRLLSDMEMESRIVVRREYSKHVAMFIETMGIMTVKYYKRLLRVVSNYLEVYDGPVETVRLNMLHALEVLIQVTWPRVPAHALHILKILVKLMYDVSTDQSLTPESVKQELMKQSVLCLIWLKRAAKDPTEQALRCLLNTELISLVKQNITVVLDNE